MFRTEALRQRIELIIHLVEFGRQLILVQGPPGLGKTSLLNALEELANPSWVFIRLTAGHTTNREVLLEKIAANLDFEPSSAFSEEQIVEEIQRRLQILQKNKQVAVLLIDDAEALPLESHSLLLTLAHREDDSTELRIVLAADNSDSSMLDQLQANADQNAVIHTVEMPTMDRDQTASLISWWHDQELDSDEEARRRLFSAATIDEIFEQSGGVPGDILVLARQKWLSGLNVELRSDPVKKYITFGILALLVIGVVTFFAKETKEPAVEELQIELPETPETIVIPEPEIAAATNDTHKDSSPVDGQEQSKTETNATSDDEPDTLATGEENLLNATLDDLRPTPAPPGLVANNELSDIVAATLAEEVIADIPVEERSLSGSDTTARETSQSATQAQPASNEATQKAGTADNDQALSSSPPETSNPKVSIKLRSQPKPPPAQQASQSPPVPSPPKPEKTEALPVESPQYSLANLLRTSPNGYVLQLFGVRDHGAAAKYVEKNRLQDTSTVVASMHEGEPWYVVIYGRYPNREAAAESAKTLGKKLDNINPWPRPISSLK